MNNAANTAQQIVSTRAVHTAMAASVEAAGLDCSKALYEAANTFNADFFGGQLTAIMVMIATPSSPRALASFTPRTPEGVDALIRVSPSVVMAGMRLSLDALLHEMIHGWQTETDNEEPGYQGHGPKFAAKCNEFGAKMGLSPVGTKGNKEGLPNCAQWPLCVRPEGYYGESKRAVKAVGSANRTRGPRTPKGFKAPVSKVDQVVAICSTMTQAELNTLRVWLNP